MIQFLASIFIKNRQDYSSPAVRQAYGTLCGLSLIHISEPTRPY